MNNEKVKKSFGQFFRFAIIGAMNTGVDLIVLNIETISTGIKSGSGYAIQKGISFLVAVTFSYFLNKHWTFKDTSKKDEGKKFSQFFFVSIIGMLINITAATVAVTYLQNPINNLLNLPSIITKADTLAQIWVTIGGLSGTAIGLIWNFIGYKFWVFKK
jgi:putative flippase GtrA